ncbi:MAG: ATP-binding protein [Desulfobacterales bacterium]|nr:ATP-binding protein [Desulfobacterales bacterium]
MRFFNTEGPVNIRKHYCLPPLERLKLQEVLRLLDQEKYFVLHAPRQTGKTSCLLALMAHLNTEGKYKCLYFNVEAAQGAREDVYRGIRSVLGEMAKRARLYLKDLTPHKIWKKILDENGEDGALNEVLTEWSLESAKPLVLLIDEIDSLIGDTLISVLRQLRAGYDTRPDMFPSSVILCGVRDVRDYRLHSNKDKALITGGSAFNIKSESFRLGDFSREELEALYERHTGETGQKFSKEAMDVAWDLSEGQPWLVNALAYETCFKMEGSRDAAAVITGDIMRRAGESLILRRATHIDQLVDKLNEERVFNVIDPVLRGLNLETRVSQDDIQYVIDIGLLRRDRGLRPANAIYKEIIPREIAFVPQLNFETDYHPERYMDEKTGMLDVSRLLLAFQQFFRENSEHWLERFQYKEAGPQLLMQAFFQNIINGGGRVEREYGFGRGRVDLLVIHPHENGEQKVVIELKIRYGDTEKTIAEGLDQTWRYMDKCGAEHGSLVIFDKRKSVSWEEKIFRREEEYKGRKITVWGM